MELTILGRYGPYPAKGGCCSGYLIREKHYNILIDCGNGVFSRLQYYINFWELDAIILSHLHSDHVSDIYIMRYALDITKKYSKSKSLPLYVPNEPLEEFNRLSYKEVYKIIPIDANNDLHIGPLILSFMPTVHSVKCYAVKIQTQGKSLVYSGDTEFTNDMICFAKNADLLLCEANLLDKHIKLGYSNHLTAGQAGYIAREAVVKKMLLTHLSPQNDPELTLAEASREYLNSEIAKEDCAYVI